MVWREVDVMSLRREFVELARVEGANVSGLCRRYGVSRKTGYKWLARAQEGCEMADQSRRPLQSPARTPERIESQVIALRQQHPAWGGRKIAARLRHLGREAPAPSTVTHILRRKGLLDPQAQENATAWQRFEHAYPNDLWQIDFMGHFQSGPDKCHALTVLDDHSRFNVVLQACRRTNTVTVQETLIDTFRRYGLPARINADNGAPWGCPREPRALSELSVWLVRLGIRCSHSRPYHPQTNGKDERFHRSLRAEVLNGRAFADLAQTQKAFENWREVYNHQRPHDALQLNVPGSRYRISPRTFPETLPGIQYGPDDVVRKVQAGGHVNFRGNAIKVSSALRGQPVAFRPSPQTEGLFHVFFCHHALGDFNLRDA